MFEALETGKSIKGSDFDRLRDELRPQLIEAQLALAEAPYSVIMIIAGFDGSGKGALVHRINEWMDPRSIDTTAFWQQSDEEESRPRYWRYWRHMPPKGQIGIMMGSWYQACGYDGMSDKLSGKALALELQEIEAFERMLTDDGTLVIKIWLHVSRDRQKMQLREEAPLKIQNPRVPADADAWWDMYPKALEISEQLVTATDSSHSPWHLVEANNPNYRDITSAQIIVEAMTEHAAKLIADKPSKPPLFADHRKGQPTVLDTVDLNLNLDREDYKAKLRKQQDKLQDLAWELNAQERSVIAVFEGWDAAGKGSAIRRVTQAIDPRLYKLVQYAAPSDEERAQHYLWRFWRNLQRDGRSTLFDRSWYGRVLVERVEGFAQPSEWKRAYNEINMFEKQLVDHGNIVVKFWIHISPDEQLARFKARESQPHKHYKITEEDWRNREKWEDYALAVEDMVAHTSTQHAPWTLVAGNSKLWARIDILKTLCSAIKKELKG
ncbi:MAG: polyphosphate:AMP phosphotransferase [Halioglobus sp.]